MVGFGGYASAPTVLAAAHAGIPIVLHEQNAVLGRANAWLAPKARSIATSFPEVRGIPARFAGTVLVTGNPVRSAIEELHHRPYPGDGETGAVSVLVMGGSQGARVFSEVVPAAIALIPEERRARLKLAQQARPEDAEAVKAAYAAIGFEAEIASFFDDIPERLAATHLLIARAGASTIAEATVAGRPAILVPYPFAMDDHQTANADSVAEAGGAWMIPQSALSPEALANRIELALAMPSTLAVAAEAARNWGRPNAAERLADAVAGLVPEAAAAGTPGAAARTASGTDPLDPSIGRELALNPGAGGGS